MIKEYVIIIIIAVVGVVINGTARQDEREGQLKLTKNKDAREVLPLYVRKY